MDDIPSVQILPAGGVGAKYLRWNLSDCKRVPADDWRPPVFWMCEGGHVFIECASTVSGCLSKACFSPVCKIALSGDMVEAGKVFVKELAPVDSEMMINSRTAALACSLCTYFLSVKYVSYWPCTSMRRWLKSDGNYVYQKGMTSGVKVYKA